MGDDRDAGSGDAKRHGGGAFAAVTGVPSGELFPFPNPLRLFTDPDGRDAV